MSQTRRKLNPKQAKFVDHLIEGVPIREAYVKAGYKDHPANPYRLRENESVAKNIERRRREVEDGIRLSLTGKAKRALDKIDLIMEDGRLEDSNKLKAAQDILNRAGFKPKDEVEHSGEVNVNLLDVLREGRKE